MVTLTQVVKGLEKYIDNEMLPKIPGWQKWVFGAAASIGISKHEELFNKLKNNSLVEMLNVIDNQNMIDIDALYTGFVEQAAKSPATLQIPAVGAFTLNAQDVEKLYMYIKEY